MLARLERLDGIERAETDFTGDFLRLSMTEAGRVADVRDALATLGYAVEPAIDVSVDSWYDARSVGELSRVEAGVIADRVVSALRRSRTLSDVSAARLHVAVVDALHRCFVTTALTSESSPSLRASCIVAARSAAVPIVGEEIADELAALVDSDMGDDHKQRS